MLLSVTVAGAGSSLLVRARVAVRAPATEGLQRIAKGSLPAVIVTGVPSVHVCPVQPWSVNEKSAAFAPVIDSAVTLSDAVPTLLRVTGSVDEPTTLTFPKPRADGV